MAQHKHYCIECEKYTNWCSCAYCAVHNNIMSNNVICDMCYLPYRIALLKNREESINKDKNK